MKINKLNTDGELKGQVELPLQFTEPIRSDLIRRAVSALRSRRRHRYGGHPTAGKRASAKISRRRRDYKGSYGHGISRVPRKILNRRGTRFYWVGAFAPGMVKGRRSHPPKSSKLWSEKINKRENRKAIRSAMAATIVKEIVTQRGHIIPKAYPFIVDTAIESASKTKDVFHILEKCGFEKEMERGAKKKIRAGRGKSRGRPYKKKKSLLIIVGNDCGLIKSAPNIPGIDVVKVNELNAEMLAPGAMPGRAVLWSESALERLTKEKLFI